MQVEKDGMLTLEGNNRGRLPGQVVVKRGNSPELDHRLKSRAKVVLGQPRKRTEP